MTSIHKAEAEPLFLRAVAVVLFLGACAYMGALLYEKLNRDMETVTVERVTVTDSAELYGIAVRREQLVCSPDGIQLLTQDGLRVAAQGEIAYTDSGKLLLSPCSALFYTAVDGYESLSPEDLDGLTPEELEQLLEQKPSAVGDAVGRLVSGYNWYFAAFCDSAELRAKGDCRILFDGMEQSVSAHVLSLSASGGKTMVLLRLNCSGSGYMFLRKTSAKLIFSEYIGLELPEEAVMTDEDGSKFVYTLTAGVVERKAVDIIYKTGKSCIAAISSSADALREGNTLIVSGENICEGRIWD